MSKILVTYSLIKSLYSEGRDYIDIFVPFLLYSFPPEQNGCNIDILIKNLKEEFGLLVPEHALRTIVKRAKKSGYIKEERGNYYLEEKGKRVILDIKRRQRDVERELNSLFEDIRNYINEKFNKSLTSDQIKELLFSFIKKSQVPLLLFFNPSLSDSLFDKKMEEESNKDMFYMVDYFKIAKDRKPLQFKVLEKIYYGSIISTILNKEDMSSINKKFNNVEVFFDTNFIFSIMELHYPHISKPARELFTLLKTNSKFKLKVFDFTIDEMIRVLKGYINSEKYRYFSGIRVNSIYSSLKTRGWSKEDCIEFLSKIENKIQELGITIEYTQVDLESWEPPDREIYSKIEQYKPDQPLLSQKHDICAIYKIREKRKTYKREIEDCVALFLSSDLKLAKFNYVEFGHINRHSVSEVISDRFFTTLLWLKNPTTVKEIPLESIISIYSEKLIDNKVWNRFYDNLLSLKEKGEISEEDIATLLYYEEFEKELALIDDPEKVNREFIMENIEKGRLKIREKINEEVQKGIEEIKEKLDRELSNKYNEEISSYINRIENIKRVIKEESIKEANKKARLVFFASILLPIILLLIYTLLSKKLYIFLNFIYFVATFLTIFRLLGIKFNIFQFRKKIYDYFFRKTYEKKLSKYGFDLNEDIQ
ncbi:MAG: hypothetical protein ACO2O6_05155 [Candidatus Hydrothermia bacterium]|jgi:phosphopantetheine adenylyltransferase